MNFAWMRRPNGSKSFGQISGFVAMCLTGARALAPVGAGALYVAFVGAVPPCRPSVYAPRSFKACR